MTEIILNLKKVVIRMTDDKPALLKIDVKGKKDVKAGDITHDGGVEVVNPDLHIATLSSDSRFYMEMKAKLGRGYQPSEQNIDEAEPIGTIPIDAIFSPITKGEL